MKKHQLPHVPLPCSALQYQELNLTIWVWSTILIYIILKLAHDCTGNLYCIGGLASLPPARMEKL